jgi:hypothetical protein
MLSRRGRLALLATASLLIAALVAAPSDSGAKPASVKQFIASISGGAGGSFTETVTNCGGPGPLEPPCTASSTIALGSVRIVVPEGFRPITTTPSVTSSPPGRNWTASYDPTTGNLDAHAAGGSDKLQPGESVMITFTPTTTACTTETEFFMTSAWGSIAISGSDPFAIQGSQPAVACVESPEGTVTGPNGQTETITGNYQGHVIVTFGGDIGPDCSSEAGFGDLGNQWEQYHLPTQVNITPASDFIKGSQDKIATSEFPLPQGGGDSSWFLICFAVPQAGHTAFETRGGGTAFSQTIGGIPHFVGILASCADAPTPCVSEQFLTTGPGAPPWSPSANRVHIAVRMAPGDPYKK